MAEEISKFSWIGNSLAIDFINTEIVAAGRLVDLLPNPAALLDWVQEAGYPSVKQQSASVPNLDSALQDAKAYRALLRTSLTVRVSGQSMPFDLLSCTNAYLAQPENIEQIVQDESGYHLTTIIQFTSPEALMIPVAHAMAKLLAEGDLSRVRKCKNPECVLYFYDISKSGTRSWCSLDQCGNKLRMAASRRRRHAMPPGSP